MKFIVTAGGQGKKIWPMSRESYPKQFQAIVGDVPLYEKTVNALLKGYKPSDIFISTKKRYYNIAEKQSPRIPKTNYILEPDIAKDRGPAEGLSFLTLSMKHPDEPFMIIQPDCLREPDEAFLRMLKEAEKIEIRDKKFMSGGIKASYPILGIDYLQLGKRISTKNNIEIYRTDEFIPRSDNYKETKKLISNFHVATHSNHNCWYPDLMLDAYKKYRPDWHGSLMKIRDLLSKGKSNSEIENIYSKMEAGATELVTNELFKDSYTILLPFKWTDIGTWDGVYEFFEGDSNGVYIDGEALALDTKTSIIKNENKNKIIVLNGVKNLVVIDTKDALLVCDKEQTQEVKKIVETLKAKKLNQYI